MAEPEMWLRGPVPGVPPMLMPVAHSLLQCQAEVRAALAGMTAEQLRGRPGGAASMEYHVRHALGSLDRLFTYARGESLNGAQRAALLAESQPSDASADDLIAAFENATGKAIEQLRATDESALLTPREVGRARLPSNVLGLLFHAAEHTQRHAGQLATTAKVVRTVPAS